MHIRVCVSIATTFLSLTFLEFSAFPLRSVQAQNDDRALRQQSSSTVQELPTSNKRFALVIGIDEYDDASITKLEGASNDAKTLASALVEYAGFPQDQVILLASGQSQGHRPTLGNILRRLSNFTAIVPKDGLLLVSFAGHGMERDGRAYLLPSDAQASNDIGLLERTALSVSDVRDRIRQTKVGQVVLILDACRNDPVSGRSGGDNPLTYGYVRGFNFDVRNKEVEAFVTLYATAVGHRAYEYRDKKQGYFTWALVEGLKGGAANDKGEVTLAALVGYLQDEVPKRVLLDYGRGRDQRPFAILDGFHAERLVISKVGPRGLKRASGTAELPTPIDEGAVELSFWQTISNSNNREDFRAYLERYPNGRFATLARIRVSAGENSSTTVAKPKPAPETPKLAATALRKGEQASYKEWYDANAARDYPTALELANAYVTSFPGGQNVAYLKGRWIPATRATLFNQAIVKKNMADMIRLGRNELADSLDNLDYLIAMSVQLRTNELFATPPNFAHAKDAAEFTERAMKLIESGKTPTPNPNSPFDKNKTVAFFEQTLAVIDDQNKNVDKALERYQHAASLDPMSPLWSFHVGRLSQTKYLAAANSYKDLPEADRVASAPNPEVKAALDDVNNYADAVINGWVRYLGLTAGKPTTGDTRSKVESVVTELYKFRNNNSIEGLAKLVEQNKTSPTPVRMPAP